VPLGGKGVRRSPLMQVDGRGGFGNAVVIQGDGSLLSPTFNLMPRHATSVCLLYNAEFRQLGHDRINCGTAGRSSLSESNVTYQTLLSYHQIHEWTLVQTKLLETIAGFSLGFSSKLLFTALGRTSHLRFSPFCSPASFSHVYISSCLKAPTTS
jgi:hypothetical protein